MFLRPQSLTVPTLAHDYPEWHKGRENYALWYVEIQHPELVEYLNQLRAIFAPDLFQPNIRQFHITLFVCGFLQKETDTRLAQHKYINTYNDNFSIEQFEQQCLQLKTLNLKPFQLKIGKINSFDSALFVEVLDVKNSLSKIRQLFAEQTNEPAALNYYPHITLGLYHSKFKAEYLYEKISQIPQQIFNIEIEHLTFGFYQAKVLQGELYSDQHIQLGSSCE